MRYLYTKTERDRDKRKIKIELSWRWWWWWWTQFLFPHASIVAAVFEGKRARSLLVAPTGQWSNTPTRAVPCSFRLVCLSLPLFFRAPRIRAEATTKERSYIHTWLLSVQRNVFGLNYTGDFASSPTSPPARTLTTLLSCRVPPVPQPCDRDTILRPASFFVRSWRVWICCFLFSCAGLAGRQMRPSHSSRDHQPGIIE